MKHQPGIFTISLDFELYWGVRDKFSIDDYREQLLGVRSAVPAILELFEEYGIHATWACVGFLFFDNLEEMIEALPERQPNYQNKALSPYKYIFEVLKNSRGLEDFHYAPDLISTILSCPHQEIATHTFSHYYCLENGNDIESFRADLQAACQIARQKYNVELKSLVFPRNQTQLKYLSVLSDLGILAYRGNENSWIYTAKNGDGDSLLRRALRLIDTYINLSGSNCYRIEKLSRQIPFDIPSSRFLRPYSNAFNLLEPLRLQRIKADLSYAAKKGQIYHLWWHPHNFGKNLAQNISFLRGVLSHYKELQKTDGIESLTMEEISEKLVASNSSIFLNDRLEKVGYSNDEKANSSISW